MRAPRRTPSPPPRGRPRPPRPPAGPGATACPAAPRRRRRRPDPGAGRSPPAARPAPPRTAAGRPHTDDPASAQVPGHPCRLLQGPTHPLPRRTPMPRLHPRVPRPSRRARRLALAVSGIGALAVAAGLVWQSAYAAFTDSAPLPALTLSTGNVAISDDDAGAVLFSAGGLRPGATQTRCITVTSTGSAPSLVRLYGTGRTTTRSLSSYLTLVISAGSGGSSASCVGFAPKS